MESDTLQENAANKSAEAKISDFKTKGFRWKIDEFTAPFYKMFFIKNL